MNQQELFELLISFGRAIDELKNGEEGYSSTYEQMAKDLVENNN